MTDDNSSPSFPGARQEDASLQILSCKTVPLPLSYFLLVVLCPVVKRKVRLLRENYRFLFSKHKNATFCKNEFLSQSVIPSVPPSFTLSCCSSLGLFLWLDWLLRAFCWASLVNSLEKMYSPLPRLGLFA